MLAGGRSSRMGSPKAALDWHGSTLLRRVAASWGGRSTARWSWCARPGRRCRSSPTVELVTTHARAAARSRVSPRAWRRSATAPRSRMSHPRMCRCCTRAFVAARARRLERRRRRRAARDRRLSPAAVRRRTGSTSLDVVERLIAADRMRPAFLFERCRVLQPRAATAMLEDPALAALDPDLDSVQQPQRAGRLRARARAAGARGRGQAVRAAARPARRPRSARPCAPGAVGDAAAAVGLALDEHVVAALNGDQITPRSAAAAGRRGRVAFMAADAGG